MIAAALPIQVSGREYNLLDGESVGELLRWSLPSICGLMDSNDVHVERCWPVGAPSPFGFVLEWSFRAKGRRHAVYGEWGGRRRVRNASLQPEQSGPGSTSPPAKPVLTADGLRGLAMKVGDAELVLRSPDQDEMLPQMSFCLDGKSMAKRLQVFGLRPTAMVESRHRFRCRLGGYRPGRRATVRFKNGESSVHLSGKTFRDDRGRRLIERHLCLSEKLRRRCGDRVRVPAPVGFDDELNMALFVWMPGLQPRPVGRASKELIRVAVETLTTIHELPATGVDEFTSTHEYVVADRWRRTISHLYPKVAFQADEILRRLAALSAQVADMEPAMIHRDFYEKQLVLAPNCVTVLDLDTLACGNVCVDLGNFLAHLLLRQLVVSGTTGGFTALADAFVNEYEERRAPVDRTHLAFYTASSLFRLGAVHALRTLTACHRATLWRTATMLLNHGTFDAAMFSTMNAFAAREEPA